MTTAGDAAGGRSGRPGARWALLGAAVLGAALLVGSPSEDGEPLDPTSSGPLGALGLVRTLEGLDADVVASGDVPAPNDDVALVLQDRLDGSGRDELLDWARQGGTLVVADPSSPLLQVEVLGELSDPTLDAGGCGIDALDDIEELSVDGVGFGVGFRGRGCLSGEGGGSFVVETPLGDGDVVAVGGAAVWVNDRLGEADNAVLASTLLAPAAGTRVVVVRPSRVGGGSASLGDLVGDGVKQALVQLGIAFLVYALWRGRRLGRPVAEDQPVELAASELVVAVGNLLQQGHHHGRAADVIRDDLRRHLAERLGLPATAEPHDVAEVAAARTRLDRGRLIALLTPASTGADADLVALAAAAHDVTQELSRAR